MQYTKLLASRIRTEIASELAEIEQRIARDRETYRLKTETTMYHPAGCGTGGGTYGTQLTDRRRTEILLLI